MADITISDQALSEKDVQVVIEHFAYAQNLIKLGVLKD